MLLGTELGFGPGDIVLGGDPALAHGKGHSIPHFSAHVCCGQTAGWIRIPLGTEVGLVAGDIVSFGQGSSLRWTHTLRPYGDIVLDVRCMTSYIEYLVGRLFINTL